MGYFIDYYGSMIVLIPAIILTIYAQVKVKSAYAKYSQIRNSQGITGLEAATVIIRNQNLGIPVQQIQGELTDNYNPKSKVLSLSQGIYGSDSVAALGIAAHECGHAVQDAEGYSLLRFRNSILPAVNLGSNLAWPLLILGLMLNFLGLYYAGLILFGLVVVFHLVTLPMELDASRRGLAMLSEYGLVSDSSEAAGAKAVLSAAAMTYLAALAMSIANLLRIIMIFGGNRRR